MYQPPVIVVGTGRSGTSIVAGMLHYLGVYMGKQFVPADRNNPAGHFEDQEFKSYNLAFLGKKLKEETFKKKVRSIIDSRATKHKRWGWKVPSTSFLLDKYIDVLYKKPKIIWCVRDEEDVKASMKKAYGWSESQSEGVIKRRTRQIEAVKESGEFEFLILQFEDIIEEPSKIVAQLIDFADLQPYDNQVDTAVSSVNQDKVEDPKILVAIYNMGWVRIEVSNWANVLASDSRYPNVSIAYPVGVKPYERNVNVTMDKFLKSDKEFDFLLMFDDENPPKKNPFDLIELNKDIMILPTPTKQEGGTHYNIMHQVRDKGFRPLHKEQWKGLRKVDGGGSGCMLIKREVIEELSPGPFTPTWDDNGLKRSTGDFNFCTKARKKGFEIWAHFDYPCGHIKEHPIKIDR